MQEKHTTSRETDITGVLVVVLVVMIGLLIVSLSNQFTQTKTSTNSRADFNARLESIQQNGITITPLPECADSHFPMGLKEPSYNAAKDYCTSNSVTAGCLAGGAYSDSVISCRRMQINGEWTNTGTCCRNKVEAKKLGDAHCVYLGKQANRGEHLDAKCKDHCYVTEGYDYFKDSDLNSVGGCAYEDILTNSLKTGVCCLPI